MDEVAGSTRTPRTTWVVRSLLALLGAAALGPLGAGAAAAQNPAASLVYSIRTTSVTGSGGCTTVRTTSGVVGVPQLVDVGGSFLPDLLVTVAALPGVNGAPDVATLAVARLAGSGLRASVAVELRPDAASDERITLGYDGCAAGVPLAFDANAQSYDDALDVQVGSSTILPSLRVFGGVTGTSPTGAPTSTSVGARLTPMPGALNVDVDFVGEDAFHADVETSDPAVLHLDYADVVGAASTITTADVDRFPGHMAIDFAPERIEYVASRRNGAPLVAPIGQVGLSVTTAAPGTDTTQLDATLLAVPATAVLERPSDTRVTFTADPDPIGSATVRYATFDPASTPPAVTGTGAQHLAADVGPTHTVAEARLLGLRFADVDAGDPVVADVHHTPGPFTIDAHVTAEDGATRQVDGRVLDLPGEAYVDFSPSTQAFHYTGSGEIGELAVDVTSSVPFVDDADTAHLLARGVPTGLTGRLDAVGETFVATLADGDIPADIDLVEVQVTSGPDERLPAGVDGVVIEDHVGSYAAFARIQGLHHVDVGWSDLHQYADVDHAAGPFHLRVDTDDVGGTDLEVDGRLVDLPARARFDHLPGQPTTCPPGRDDECETPLVVSFASEEPGARIGELTFDVVAAEPLVGDATEAHLVASDLPPLTVVVDATNERFVATTTGGTLGGIAAEVCDPAGCGLLDLTGPDGAFLVDLHQFADAYDAVVRLSGLRHADVSWGSPVSLDLDHDPGPFDVLVEQDYDVVVPNHPDPQPPPPCDLPKPRDCELVDDDEPLPPDSHVVTFRRSLQLHLADVPTIVDLAYDPDVQRVDYDGSEPIGLLEAHYTDGRALVGRARFAHLLATGLPTHLRLSWDFADDHEFLLADSGGSPLGHLELELLSDLSLRGAVYQSPGFRDGFDGIVLWDLSDFEGSGVEPVDDAYAIAVRSTGLQRILYQRGPFDDGTFAHERVSVDMRRTTRTPLWVEVQQADETREPREVPGLGDRRAELINLDYANPPEHLGFLFDHRTRGVHDVYDLLYYGSSTGDLVDFRTNVGDGGDFDPFIDLRATPVPGGGDSLDAPGVAVCIGSNNMRCSDVNREDFDSGQFSLSMLVSQPMTLSGRYDAGDASVRVQDVFIEHGIVASSEENTDGFNSTSLYIDTRGGVVQGTVRVLEKNIGGSNDTQEQITMPPGFMAFAREVEMEYEGTGFTHGRVVCPAGFLLTHEAIGIDVNLEGRFCARPRIDSVTDLDGNAPVLGVGTHELIVNGTNFVPNPDGANGSPGTLFTVGGWTIDRNTFQLTYDTDVVVTGVVFVDLSTVRITVEVTEDAADGDHRLSAFNPISFPINVGVLDDAIRVE